jgi:hypothetical protein
MAQEEKKEPEPVEKKHYVLKAEVGKMIRAGQQPRGPAPPEKSQSETRRSER